MSDRPINPLGNLYASFLSILKCVTIKYTGIAEKYETMESRMLADTYLEAMNGRDSFFSYADYTDTELMSVGITNLRTIREVVNNQNIKIIPESYRDALFKIRHERELSMYEETNNYYRSLNGLPDINDTDYIYLPDNMMAEYGIDKKLPIHLIQDYYNKQGYNLGNYYISLIEGSGFIEEIQNKYPEKKYLKYIGTSRISVYSARSAKNFQIIQLKESNIKDELKDEFVRIYEQCREYFVKTIYNYSYRDFFERYDNFIAMSIMVMTIQQTTMRQLETFVNRNFFDINAVRMLYEAYDIPYDLNIDEDTQNILLKNINLFIQNKATDKVLYNIAHLMGFSNIKIYKYFLTKERQYDSYGTPIVKWTKRFNSDTGEFETVPDYKAMYDVYFQKSEISENDLAKTYLDATNHIPYDDITTADPFWIEDQPLSERVWETQYNYVESKYLGLGVSYSITEIMFENILFFKLIMQKSNDLDKVTLKLPRITDTTNIPLFDVIIALICLTSCKHNIYGEIITVPTQVISVLDYIKNTEDGDINLDTLKFNFNYFFNPDEKAQNDEVEEFKNKLITYMNTSDKVDNLVDTFQFNFDYFDIKRKDREQELESMKFTLEPEDYKLFRKYVDIIMQDTSTNIDKIGAINDIYKNIKNLHSLLRYYLTKICNNRREYEKVKRLYDALFYSKEMSELFTITGGRTGHTRTAFTYFEFLYHKNPLLYKSLFKVDLEVEYTKYLSKENKSEDYTYDMFLDDIEYGKIFIDYGKFINDEDIDINDTTNNTERIYYYTNHIISRLQTIIEDIEFMYMMNDTETPLEDLLLRLVRFFKSYTTDIIGLDRLFILNTKPENSMKIFDEIYSIQKWIQKDDKIRLSYGDVIHLITSILHVDDEHSIKLKDKLILLCMIYFTNRNENSIRLIDLIKEMGKDIDIDENHLQKLYDVVSIDSNLFVKCDNKLSDKIIKLWYTD